VPVVDLEAAPGRAKIRSEPYFNDDSIEPARPRERRPTTTVEPEDDDGRARPRRTGKVGPGKVAASSPPTTRRLADETTSERRLADETTSERRLADETTSERRLADETTSERRPPRKP